MPREWVFSTEHVFVDPDWDDLDGQEFDAVQSIALCGTLATGGLAALHDRPFTHEPIPHLDWSIRYDQEKDAAHQRLVAEIDRVRADAEFKQLSADLQGAIRRAALQRLEQKFRDAEANKWRDMTPVERYAHDMSAACNHYKPFDWYMERAKARFARDGASVG